MELLNVPTIGAVDSKVLLLDGVTAKSAPITVAGRELIACDSNVSQRESLGLGALATLSSINLSTNFAVGVLPIAKGGTGSNSGLPYGSVKDLTYPSILGRKANTTGNAELLSASDVLNMIGTTHGSILYRGASGWLELAPGTPGYALVTQGPNQNPAWSTVTASVSNGDKGDITVSNSGTTWIIDNDVVTYAKIQNVSATNKVLGRKSLGPGDVEEIDCTTAGRAIIGAADAASQRTILELVSIATTGSASDLGTGTIPDARFPALTGDVTSTAGTVSTTIAANAVTTTKIANDNVTYAKIQNVSATNKVLGRSSLGPGDIQEIDCTAAGRAIIGAADAASQRTVLELVEIATTGSADHLGTGTVPAARFPALTGDITSTAGTVSTTIGANAVTTSKIANDNVTYAKIQNVAASRILGRKANTAGDIEECTLSEVLDLVGSPSQGDILYRNATGWTRLGAGTANYFLKTQGPNANPVWAEVASGSGGKTAVLQFSSPSLALSVGIPVTANKDAYPMRGYALTQKVYTRHKVDFNPTSYELAIVIETEIFTGSAAGEAPNPIGLTLEYSTNDSTWIKVADWDLRDVLGLTTISGALSISGTPTYVLFRLMSYNQNAVAYNLNAFNLVLNVWK